MRERNIRSDGPPSKWDVFFVTALRNLPATSPRDAVTISRLFNDTSTIIDISTSLPRSPDEPAYLRPSPPYVRSNVTCKHSYSSTPFHRLIHSCSICLVYSTYITSSRLTQKAKIHHRSPSPYNLFLATRSTGNMGFRLLLYTLTTTLDHDAWYIQGRGKERKSRAQSHWVRERSQY